MMLSRHQVEENWKKRGFSCDIWVDPPGQVWEDFRHETDELFMVIEGQIELEMKGESMQPQPGEEILIPAGVLHSVRNQGATTSRWYYGYQSKSI